ncbi:hypothetical protein K440DRAFT_642762 [Wilcoxina mikolae CBS 423.85]|nr:hypothetical protein K440DRAFT_642762 [Wilcoxina mikolae CBS 423.85]
MVVHVRTRPLILGRRPPPVSLSPLETIFDLVSTAESIPDSAFPRSKPRACWVKSLDAQWANLRAQEAASAFCGASSSSSSSDAPSHPEAVDIFGLTGTSPSLRLPPPHSPFTSARVKNSNSMAFFALLVTLFAPILLGGSLGHFAKGSRTSFLRPSSVVLAVALLGHISLASAAFDMTMVNQLLSSAAGKGAAMTDPAALRVGLAGVIAVSLFLRTRISRNDRQEITDLDKATIENVLAAASGSSRQAATALNLRVA